METGKTNTPPLMYMLIDTKNKSTIQLETEVREYVTDKIDRKLYKLKAELNINSEEYRVICDYILREKEQILKQFIFQIRHMEEINKLSLKEVERVI